MSDFDALFDDDDGRPTNSRSKKARTNRGDLHSLLTKKLPDLIDPQTGICNLHKVAQLRGMSFQGVYKWFKDRDENRLPYAQAVWLVDLSTRQKKRPDGFMPMTIEDIQPFIKT